MGVAVGLVMGSDMGSVIVYYMGSVYSKVALCEWVTEWGQWQLKKKWKLSFATLQYQPMICTFSLSTFTFLFSCLLTFKLVKSHISDWFFMFFYPNPIERNSSSSPSVRPSVTFFTHPNSEHFMCIFNRWALQGPLDFNRYSLQRKSKFGSFFL